MDATSSAREILEGITVVALEQAVAAPFATRQLADLGARVIKIERQNIGDFARDYDRSVLGQSSYFVWLNRGKESIELDLKDPEDKVVLERLIDRADVFIQNLAPGAAERLGFGAQQLREGHERLITCTISGYGSDGPYRDKKAYDLLVQCEAGLVAITGTAEEPVKVGISVADISAGMYAYSGILAALYERERTGRGSKLDVSLFDALSEWMSQPVYYHAYGGRPLRRTGSSHASISPYGAYTAADGSQVFIGIQNEREWKVFCERVLGQPTLASDTRFQTNIDRVDNDAELRSIIQRSLADLIGTEVVSLLDDAGIANAQLRSPQELPDHPQLSSRARWREVATPAGSFGALLPPVEVEGHETAMKPVPALGQHGAAIRAELGLAADSRQKAR